MELDIYVYSNMSLWGVPRILRCAVQYRKKARRMISLGVSCDRLLVLTAGRVAHGDDHPLHPASPSARCRVDPAFFIVIYVPGDLYRLVSEIMHCPNVPCANKYSTPNNV